LKCSFTFSLVLALVTCCWVGLGAQDTVQPKFEVASIKPVGRNALPPGIDEENPCSGAVPRLGGRTLDGPALTLYALIALAYNPWKQAPGACALATTSNLISGGPDWTRSARYAIQARFPEGADPGSYEGLLNSGEGADAQRRLQSLLEERFKLTVRRETRQLPVYLLVVDDGVNPAKSKMARSAEIGHAISANLQTMNSIFTSYPTEKDGTRYVSISFGKQPVARLAQRLTTAAQRPVLDRTGLEGVFDFILEYDDNGAARPTLFTAVREQLGLRLRPSQAALDVLIIDHVERPTGN
jgi:bla regulator protein BlaR1